MKFRHWPSLLPVALLLLSGSIRSQDSNLAQQANPSQQQAKNATAATESAAACCAKGDQKTTPTLEGFQSVTEWLPADRRQQLTLAGRFVNQDGDEKELASVIDRPTALTFFYSRCRNANKCAAAVSSFAKLQKLLRESKIGSDVRLVMISYEPANDTPDILKAFGTSRGIDFSPNAQMLSLEEESLKSLLEQLAVPVGRNSGWVSIHGIALYLIDSEGRVAREHHTLMWDADLVSQDLRRLLQE